MHRFFAATGRFAVRFRWAIVVAWVAAAVLANLFFPSLASVARQNSASSLPASSPSLQAARLATSFQGLNETPVPVVIARSGGRLTTADMAAVGRLAASLAKVRGVRQVKNLGASRDGQAVQLQVLASIDLSSDAPARHLVAGLRHTIQASLLPGNLHAHLAGPVAAQADVSRGGQRTVDLGQDLSILFILVLLIVVFRSLLAPLLTLAPAVLVTQLAGPVVAEASQAGLQVTSLTQIMLLMLLAGLTLTPALLAIFGRAAFWPSNTARGTQRLGWWGRTAGRIVTHPATTLTLGLLLFGGLATAAIDYTPAGFGGTPAAPHGSDSAAGNAVLAAHFPAATGNPTLVLLRFPAPVWRDPAPVARAEQRLAAVPEFSSLTGPLDVNGVTLTPAQLMALHTSLGDPAALPAQSPPGSAVRAAQWAVYRAASQFVSPDGRTVLFDAGLTAGDPGSNAALHQMPAIRAAVTSVARDTGASAYGVAGEAPATYDVSQASDRDLVHIFPVAIIVIAILLALVMRSLIAPLYLIASVAVSYLAAFGVSVLLFQDATGAGGLNYFIPFLMFVFLLALGEDYNILVMTRIREEAGRMPLRQAVSRALEHTRPTVTSAGLVLAGTFGVFALVVGGQPGGGIYQGILASLAVGILMDAFLVRTLLVPSTVALLGRWNWWPSAHGRPADDAPDLTATPAGVR